MILLLLLVTQLHATTPVPDMSGAQKDYALEYDDKGNRIELTPANELEKDRQCVCSNGNPLN